MRKMIVRNHPPDLSMGTKEALHGWGVAFAKIRRNPDPVVSGMGKRQTHV